MPEEMGSGPYTLKELTEYFEKGLAALKEMQATSSDDAMAEEAMVDAEAEMMPEEMDMGAMLEEESMMPETGMDITALLEAEEGVSADVPMEDEAMDLEALTAKAAKNALA